MEMCYHMFIYAEFELIKKMFLKKDAQNISCERTVTGKFAGHLFNLRYTVCFGIHSLNTKCFHCFMYKPRFQFGYGNLV